MALSDFASLKTELADRGYDYLSDSRRGIFVNRAYHLLCEEHPWPFLEQETTGTAPLSISDLRQVLYVVDTTNDEILKPVDQRTIRDFDPDLTSSSNPERWYLENNELNVWPVNTTASLKVRYLEVPDDLSGDTDTPVVPARYLYLISDAAVYYALKDNDEHASAMELKAAWDLEVEQMARTLLNRNYAGNEYIVDTSPIWTQNA